MNNSVTPLIKLNKVSKLYSQGRCQLQALNNISLEIESGTTLGVVGESGCGKSTLGRVILKLEEATRGEIYFQNQLISGHSAKQMQPLRQRMQMIFQDPSSSLNPRFTIEQIIGEGLTIHQLAPSEDERKEIIGKLISAMGFSQAALQRYPHEFSGGQRQRIAIARALALNPRLIVCDEPLSALDTCTQKQVMELLVRFKAERGLTYLFISHDLHAVKKISDRVAVMYLGHLIELANVERLYNTPLHPYTEALLDAVPVADPVKERARKRLKIYGEMPSPCDPPKGCPFHPRCPKASQQCKETVPVLREAVPGHHVACHFAKVQGVVK